jgi:hypothetical protein
VDRQQPVGLHEFHSQWRLSAETDLPPIDQQLIVMDPKIVRSRVVLVALSIILQYLEIQAPATSLLPLSMLRKKLQGLVQGVDELVDVIEVVAGKQAW